MPSDNQPLQPCVEITCGDTRSVIKKDLSILLVDQDWRVHTMLRELLTELGSNTALERVVEYDAALAAMAAKKHDIFLVDYLLGERTGLQLVTEGIASGCVAPIILMTANHERDVDMAAIAAGAADYLIKEELTVSLLERSIRYALERKRVGDALRKSEDRLARAQRIAHLGNWDWDINTNEMFWSDETYRILGLYPRVNPATYEEFLRAVHAEDRSLVNSAVNEAIYLQKPLSIEHRVVLPYGGERTVHQQGEVTLDEQGKPLRMVATLHDITERRRAEDGLRQMEEKFSKAFHASPDWVVMSSASDGCYIEVNEAFLALTGYTRSEIIGNTSISLGIWADPGERVRMLKRLDECGSVRDFEVKFRMKSGDIRIMLWSADVIDYKGEACLIAVARDVTEQRELENELVKSQAELHSKHEELTRLFALVENGKKEWQLTIDQLHDMIILADAHGRIRRCNRAFREFCRVPYEQLRGEYWSKFLGGRETMPDTILHEPTGRWFTVNRHALDKDDDRAAGGAVITIREAGIGHDKERTEKPALRQENDEELPVLPVRSRPI